MMDTAYNLKLRNSLRITFISEVLKRQILKHSSKPHQVKLGFCWIWIASTF